MPLAVRPVVAVASDGLRVQFGLTISSALLPTQVTTLEGMADPEGVRATPGQHRGQKTPEIGRSAVRPALGQHSTIPGDALVQLGMWRLGSRR